MSKFHNVFVGCETGLLKGVNGEKKTWDNLNIVEGINRDREITAMCWGNSDETEMYVGLRNQMVNVYNIAGGQAVASYNCTGGKGPLKGVVRWDQSFITCTESGLLRVWRSKSESDYSEDIDSGGEPPGPVVEIDVGDNIYTMRNNPQQCHLVATGGKENDLKLWDLQQPSEPVFKAKNVRNDWLNLRVPVWVTGVGFLDTHKLVTSTGHHQIRVYDPSSPQRRPVLDIEFDEYPLTALALHPNTHQVVVGNTHGNMGLLDLRGKGHLVHTFKGFGGGIRSVMCHPDLDLVASCGLDRHLRIHDLTSKALLQKIYLKSRMNCLLMGTKWKEEAEKTASGQHQSEPMAVGGSDGSDTSDSEMDMDDEKLWSDMPVVGSKDIQRKRKEPSETNAHKKDVKKKAKLTQKTISEESESAEEKSKTTQQKTKKSGRSKGRKPKGS